MRDCLVCSSGRTRSACAWRWARYRGFRWWLWFCAEPSAGGHRLALAIPSAIARHLITNHFSGKALGSVDAVWPTLMLGLAALILHLFPRGERRVGIPWVRAAGYNNLLRRAQPKNFFLGRPLAQYRDPLREFRGSTLEAFSEIQRSGHPREIRTSPGTGIQNLHSWAKRD